MVGEVNHVLKGLTGPMLKSVYEPLGVTKSKKGQVSWMEAQHTPYHRVPATISKTRRRTVWN